MVPGVAADPSERIAAEIRAAGHLGLTTSQLAKALGAGRSEIDGRLRELVRRRRIVRVGHGLWIDPELRRFPERAPGFVTPERYTEEFAAEHRLTVEQFAGPVQFRANAEEPVHRWWPYVQGFSAGLVRELIGRHAIGPGATVLDPYAGSGTVLATARRAGAASIGVELMPISAFVSRAKQHWEVDPTRLTRAGRRVLRAARAGPLGPRPFLRETDRQFAPGPLRSLRRLAAALPDRGEPVGDLLALAFARILVDSSRMRRSPCLGYGPKAAVPEEAPYAFFERAVQVIAEDLRALAPSRAAWGPPAEVVEADSRAFRRPPGSVDLAVTSPPYANGMDYVMNYKLELAWLGFARSYEDLRALKARMVACDNLPAAALAERSVPAALAEDAWLAEILPRIRDQLARKSSYRRADVDRVLEGYFADLWPTIQAVYAALRPGGAFVVVNGDSFLAGTYVPADLLYARLAEAAGFRVERFEIARGRRSGQRRDIALRESVLTLRRPPRSGAA